MALLQSFLPRYLVWFVFSTICTAAFANQTFVVIGTTEIPGQLTKRGDSNSEYDRLLSRLSNVRLVFAPYSRVELLFESSEVDCLFPASTATIPNKAELIESLPFIQSPAYLFSATPYKNIQEFKGKSIAIQRGLSAGGIRDSLPAEYIDLDSEEALVRFLALGRADAFIAYLSDIEAVYQEVERSIDFYAQDQPVYVSQEAFVCRNTPRLAHFIKRANEHIKRFSDDTL